MIIVTAALLVFLLFRRAEMIEFKDVAFQYEQGSSKGKIENINLTIHDGEVVLICGESGCGKTTLTRLINGLIPHYYEGTLTGQTIVEGIDVKMYPFMLCLVWLVLFFKIQGHNFYSGYYQ